MSAGNPVLDINKTPQENLLAKFNLINATQLLGTDYEFGVPEPEQDVNRTTNTQVALIPTLISRFANGFTLHYNRMDVSEIFENTSVSIARGTGENLSDLIDEINEAFGIKLTSDDYYDTALPPINTQDPGAEVPVMIAIKPGSYLFQGSYLMTLNRSVSSPSLEGDDDANLYVVINTTDPVYKQRIRAYTLAGELIAGFVFLRNAVVVTNCQITKVIQLKNKDFALLGDFSFTSSFEGGAALPYTVKTIVMTPAGAIRSVSASGLFGATLNLTYYNRRGSDYVYSVSSGAVVRYTQAGVLDFGFTPESAGYTPALVQECPDGKYYTASAPTSVQVDHDSDPGSATIAYQEVRIDRFNTNGTVDTSFNTVKLHREDQGEPWKLINIAPVFSGQVGSGFYLSLSPDAAVSNTSTSMLLVNRIPLVPANEPGDYGVLPVVKFNQSGVWTNTFKNAQRNSTAEAVYNPAQVREEVTGNRTAVASEDGVVFLTRRMNPITGFMQRIPVMYDNQGEMQKIAGGEYYASHRWMGAVQMRRLTNGTLVVWGTRYPHDLNGGWAAPVPSVCAYQKDTRPQNIIADIAAAGETLAGVYLNEE